MRPPDSALTGLVDGPATEIHHDVTQAVLPELRHAVRAGAARAGLHGERLDDFILAVHELATNAIRHGGGHGRLRLHRLHDSLLCEVSDHGPGFGDGIPASASPPPASVPGGRGLWLARQLTDTLLIMDRANGATVTITVCVTSGGGQTALLQSAVAADPSAPEPDNSGTPAMPHPHGRDTGRLTG